MPTLFSVRPGYAIRLNDGSITGAPLRLSLDGWPGFTGQNAIVTGVSVNKTGIFQFMHTFRGFIYVYVFNDRISDIALTGITFTGQCDGFATTGFDAILNYYDSNAVPFRADPIGVELGSKAFLAFLVRTKVDIVNPKAGLGQFLLSFKSVPRE